MRVLVTGATGFVGTHLCRLLLEQTDWQVTGVNRKATSAVQSRLTVRQLDLLDAAATRSLLAEARPTVIVHLAAQSSVAISLREPAVTLVGNQLMQLHLLEACRATGLDPLILVASSIDVYGDGARDGQALTESHPLRPLNPYAVSKVAQEMLGLHYALSFGQRVIRLRLGNHIGPGQRPDFAIPNFARQIARAEQGMEPATLAVGNLSVRRDFLDVRDVAHAYLQAIQCGRPGAIYNIGSGQARRMSAVVEQMVGQARVPMRIEPDPGRWRPADVPISLIDASPFRTISGWRPRIAFEQTIADMLDEWRRQVADEPSP